MPGKLHLPKLGYRVVHFGHYCYCQTVVVAQVGVVVSLVPLGMFLGGLPLLHSYLVVPLDLPLHRLPVGFDVFSTGLGMPRCGCDRH